MQDSPYERSNRAWLTPADPELAAAAVSAVVAGAAVSVAVPVRRFEADVLLSARCCHGGRCCARREVHGCNLWERICHLHIVLIMRRGAVVVTSSSSSNIVVVMMAVAPVVGVLPVLGVVLMGRDPSLRILLLKKRIINQINEEFLGKFSKYPIEKNAPLFYLHYFTLFTPCFTRASTILAVVKWRSMN